MVFLLIASSILPSDSNAMPVRSKLRIGIIIGGFSTLFIAYHWVIQADALSGLTLMDIGMTTGFKPILPIFEIMFLSFFITGFCGVIQEEKSKEKWYQWYQEPQVFLLAIPAFLLQFIHLIFDHAGRWPLIQNWTNPGEIPDSGLIIYGVELIVFIFIASCIGSAMGWIMVEMRSLFQD